MLGGDEEANLSSLEFTEKPESGLYFSFLMSELSAFDQMGEPFLLRMCNNISSIIGAIKFFNRR